MVRKGYSYKERSLSFYNQEFVRGFVMETEIKIVALGGGTGLSILLRGLKKITSEVTAIVSVADDGGGSGVLREDLGMLPPGDIRSCILALANTEPIMEDLIKYRFKEGALKGQSFGNLLIAALVGISGSFEQAVEKISDIVAITGRVLPVTPSEMTLIAELADGSKVEGESMIPVKVLESGQAISKISTKESQIPALSDAIEAIEEADIIVMGPGSLYTSIIPNLLVEGIVDAICSSKAKRVYIPNIMTQPGETDDYTVQDHVQALVDHGCSQMIDLVLVNDTHVIDEHLEYYEAEGSTPVYLTQDDKTYLNALRIGYRTQDFMLIDKGYVKHDANKIAKCLIEMVDTKIYRKLFDE